jgi:hypothetical protein
LASPPFVVAILVGHVPIGQDDNARRTFFALPALFRGLDFEIDVVSIFAFLIEVALKPVGPVCVVLDNLLEVVEELAVGIHAGDFNVRTGVANEIPLEKWDGLESF